MKLGSVSLYYIPCTFLRYGDIHLFFDTLLSKERPNKTLPIN